MNNGAWGNSMWHLVLQADAVSKCVLLILLAMSVTCWAIFLYKLMLLRVKNRQMKSILNKMKALQTIDELFSVATLAAGSLPGFFLSKNLSYLKIVLQSRPPKERLSLTKPEWELVQEHSYQTIDSIIENEESYLTVLSTSADVATLLGLFGTVWGLVHAFISISERQSADITTVAPGIAEALLTTLGGLMVAIPALVMFSYLRSQIRTLERQCETLAEKMRGIIQRLVTR